MEYCGAGSLSDLMAICDTTLTELQIAAVMKQSLQGLVYLHGSKMIHRDLKSGNILLTHNGECKLADFGVSAELASTLAKRQTMIGTPYFMAPEVLQNSQYDSKADIWSIAITAYELAVGAPPLADMHPMRAIFQIPNGPPPTLPDPENYSAEFKDFLAKCLQKNPAQRPTAQQLLSHPFVKDVKEKAVIQDLLEECLRVIEEYREAEAKEQQENRAHVPGAGPAVGEGEDGDTGAAGAGESGTMINKGAAQSGTMLGPSQAAWSGPEDGTVVVKAKQLVGFAGGAAAAAGPSSNASGTMVVNGGAAPESGTLLIRPSGASREDHFGTVKVQRAEQSRKAQPAPTMIVNAAGTMLVNGIPQGVAPAPPAAAAAGAAAAAAAGAAAGADLSLNTGRAVGLFAGVSAGSSAAEIENVLAQLNSLLAADQQAVATFYAERMRRLKELHAKAK